MCRVQPDLRAVDQCPLAAEVHLPGESVCLLLPRTPSAQSQGLAWRGVHAEPHTFAGSGAQWLR